MEIIQNKIKIIIIAMLITMIIINVATPVFAATGTTINNNLFDNIVSKIGNFIQSIINSIIELFMNKPIIEPPIVTPEEINYVFIGDSRTVMMFDAAENKIKETGNVVKEFSKRGANHNTFFGDDTLSTTKYTLKNAPKGTKVIIWLGVNDLHNADKYKNTVNELAKEYSELEFYYISVTAVNETKAKKISSVKNKQIEDFNKKIKNNLSTDVKYIDINTGLKDTLVNGTTDGVHYTETTSVKIWETIYSKI